MSGYLVVLVVAEAEVNGRRYGNRMALPKEQWDGMDEDLRDHVREQARQAVWRHSPAGAVITVTETVETWPGA